MPVLLREERAGLLVHLSSESLTVELERAGWNAGSLRGHVARVLARAENRAAASQRGSRLRTFSSVSIFISTVFPAPDGPMIARMWPPVTEPEMAEMRVFALSPRPTV